MNFSKQEEHKENNDKDVAAKLIYEKKDDSADKEKDASKIRKMIQVSKKAKILLKIAQKNLSCQQQKTVKYKLMVFKNYWLNSNFF